MNDWSVLAAPSSPPRRSSIWEAPYSPEPLYYAGPQVGHATMLPAGYLPSHWSSPAVAPPLAPSANIWGTQLQQKPELPAYINNVFPMKQSGQLSSYASAKQPFTGLGVRRDSIGSVPSLASSMSSSSLWHEDPYLVSPPPSPQSSPVPQQQHPASMTPPVEGIAMSPTSGPLYLVQFKGERLEVYTAPGTTAYGPGDAVMVDADRGRDLGVVFAANVTRHEASALKLKQQHDRQQLLLHSGNTPNQTATSFYTPKQILGHASSSEMSDMALKRADEDAAIALCNQKVKERKLDLVIVDAEYQWDRRKLTFFYTANARVDFRELVRELFRVYKTRIWMCATSHTGGSAC